MVLKLKVAEIHTEVVIHALKEEYDRVRKAGGDHYSFMTLEELGAFINDLRNGRLILVPFTEFSIPTN